MKNLLVYIFVLTTLGLTSCKKEKTGPEEPAKTETVEAKKLYSVNPEVTKVNWTAYKTTAKTPVKGQFTVLRINTPVESETKAGAFSNLDFEIPVSSFFSNDNERDTKIKALFFGVMENTTLVTGKFTDVQGNDTEGTMTLNLIMNGNSIPVPMTYTIENQKVTINGTITNLLDWKMEDAFNSLHKACETLHTGEDGVSKTWQEVAIEAVAMLKQQ